METEEFKCNCWDAEQNKVCQENFTNYVLTKLNEEPDVVLGLTKCKRDITVHCPKGHITRFVIEHENGKNKIIESQCMTEDDLNKYNAELAELKTTINYKESIKKIEAYATWILTGTTVTGIAGVATTMGFEKMGMLQSIFVGISLVFMSVALGNAVLAKTPSLLSIHLDEVASYKDELNKLIKAKGKKIGLVGLFYALALFFAGVSPLVSKIGNTDEKEKVKIISNITDGTSYDYKVECINIAPEGLVEMRLQGFQKGTVKNLNVKTGFADEFGKYSEAVNYLMKQNKYDSVLLNIKWNSVRGTLHDSVVTFYKKPLPKDPVKKGKK